MSKLRKLLETKIEPKRIEVEYDGETYAVFGMPDDFLLSVEMMEENKRIGYAQLWTTHLRLRNTPGVPFTKDDVFKVLLVAHYIENEPGEEPLSDTDVAILSRERGLLFTKLFAASLKIVGNTDDSQLDALTAVGLGNSDAGEPATSV